MADLRREDAAWEQTLADGLDVEQRSYENTRSGVVNPARGEIWGVDLNPTIGRQRAGRRPALVVSINALNGGPRGLVIVVRSRVQPGGCRPT